MLQSGLAAHRDVHGVGIKRFRNDELRQRLVDATVSEAEHLGRSIPSADLALDQTTGHYTFGEAS